MASSVVSRCWDVESAPQTRRSQHTATDRKFANTTEVSSRWSNSLKTLRSSANIASLPPVEAAGKATSAKKEFHKQLSLPTANAPTNFPELAKELKLRFETPRKRAASFGAPTENVGQDLEITKMSSPKKPRTGLLILQ